MTLRLSSVGVRGFVGTSLTPRIALDVASAFGTFAGGNRILVARDTRDSSLMLHSAVCAGLAACGCEVGDMGVCPTPLMQWAIPVHGAAGGIAISGGHHGMGWNALTLVDRAGAVVEPVAGEAVLDIYHAGQFAFRGHDAIGAIHAKSGVDTAYLAALAGQVDADAIRRAAFTVLIDPVGGSGCPYLAGFAQTFGCRLIGINAQPSGYLAREPEPRPRSASQMAAIIGAVRGHAGFVLSSDMGRLSLVTEDGEPVSEELTFPLLAEHVLRKRCGPVVVNCCTSRSVDEVAARHGAPVIRTMVGQSAIAAALADEGGVIGGEGSGRVSGPSFTPAFDGFLRMALVLEAMAVSGQPLSRLLRALPRYHIVKRKVACHPRRSVHVLDAFKRSGPSGRFDGTDGMRFDWDDGWIHIRASDTEPIIRVISEAKDRATAARRADEAVRFIEQEV